jgi:hypothetical protein
MPIGAVIGAAVVGAGATVVSGNKAASAVQKGTDQSVAEQRRQADQARADQAPFRDTGVLANDKLASLYGVQRAGGTYTPPAANADGTPTYGGFETSPGYQFRFDQGMRAVERGAAARGLLRSGAAVKATQRFGEGLASSEYENFANRLASLAGVGQTATQATSVAGANAANNISNAYMTGANARASAYQNTGNAISGLASDIGTAYMYNKGGGFKIPKAPTTVPTYGDPNKSFNGFRYG